MANPLLGTALMAVPVTMLYGALNALVTLALGLNVSRLRNKYTLYRGDGGHADLAAAVRAHGNNAEHVPLILILMLTAELCGGASMALHLFGGGLLLSRLSHGAGVIQGSKALHFPGAMSTFLLEGALAIYLLILRPWS